MNPYQLFETSKKHETDGIVLDYGDFKITVSRAGGANQKYNKLLAEKVKPYRRRFETGTMDNEMSDRLMAEVYAESVVIGWQNVRDRDGQVIAFTRDACVKLFLDLPDLFRDVQEQAMRVANFRAQELEADSKN